MADYCPKACGRCVPDYKPPRVDDALDFQFGDEQPLEPGQTAHLVQPGAGRLVMFSSGRENVHQVRPVRTGTRYVMSMWFTCDPDRVFPDFLDGSRAWTVY